MKVGVAGGPPQKVCDLNPGIISRGGSWNGDGVLIFNNGPAPLFRAPASGGDATMMGKLADGEVARQFPAFLPDGRHFLYSGGSKEKAVYVGSLDDDTTTRVLLAETGAVYDARSGRVLFVRSGTLLAQAFDLKTLTVSGDTVTVAEHVESAIVPGLVAFSVSDNGVLAYGIGESAETGFRLTWVDRAGKAAGAVGPEGQYRGVSLSPDGRHVAVHRHDGDGGDIWLMDLARGTPSRLTFDATQENATPVWSPDGSRVAYSSIRDGKPGIYVKAVNTSGAEERPVGHRSRLERGRALHSLWPGRIEDGQRCLATGAVWKPPGVPAAAVVVCGGPRTVLTRRPMVGVHLHRVRGG